MSESLSFRPCSPEDAAIIASWISLEERDFLGAESGELQDAVIKWMSEGPVARVLTLGDGPIAFCNAVQIDAGKFEVGRLIVAPSFRRKGHGTRIVRRILRDLEGSGIALARVHKKNSIALQFFSELEFRPTQMTAIWASENKYQWFTAELYEGLSFFGRKVREIRQRLGLQQKELLPRLGCGRSTFSDIERGTKWPSREVLQRLLDVLDLDEYEVVELLFALVGRRPSPLLRSVAPTESSAEAQQANLWIVTDVIAELAVPGFYPATIKAVSNGFRRVYFLDSLENELIERFSRDLPLGQLHQMVAIYKAPQNLTNLRMVVRNPAGTDAESLTIEGQGGARIPVSDSIRQRYFLFLQGIILDESKRLWP